MKQTIKRELKAHILGKINDGVLTDENRDEWHFHAFNEDYYLIGYYQCSEWLKRHGIGELEGASICRQYEINTFGESRTDYDNSEKVVNMLAYIYGGEVIGDFGSLTLEQTACELMGLKRLNR